MFTQKLLKCESISESTFVSNSGSTKLTKQIGKCPSAEFLNNISPLGYLKTSKIIRNYKRTIYDNFKVNKAHSVEIADRELRQMSMQIRQRHSEKVNEMYKLNIKTSLMEKYSDLFLTANKTSSVSNINDSSLFNFNENSQASEGLTINAETTKLPPIDVDKMRKLNFSFRIGALYGDKKSGTSLAATSREIYLIKTMQEYKKKRLNRFEEEKLAQLESVNEDYKSLSFNKQLLNKYDYTFKEYLKFLKSKISQEKDILDDLSDSRLALQIEVNSLLGNIIKTQENLEKLIVIRNFIIRVRERNLVLPQEVIDYSKKETRKGYIFSEIKSMKSKINISVAEKFLNDYMEENPNWSAELNALKSPPTNSIHIPSKNLPLKRSFSKKSILTRTSSKSLSKKMLPLFILKSINLPEKYRKYVDQSRKIFENNEDFNDTFKDLNDKNLNLIMENEKIKREVMECNLELSSIQKENERYNTFLSKTEEEKEKLLEELKKKYYHLSKTYGQIQNAIYLTNATPTNESEKSYNLSGSFINQEMIRYMKYIQLSKKYPYSYSVMLLNLVDFINKFIGRDYFGYNTTKLYSLIKHDDFTKASNMRFNSKNKNEIHSLCLKLMVVYENIIEFVLNKHDIFLDNPKLKEETIKLVLLNQRNVKLQNARIVRNVIEQKRQENINEILEKDKKILFLPKKKLVDKFNPNNWRKKNSNKVVVHEPTKDEIFEEMINYTNDE